MLERRVRVAAYGVLERPGAARTEVLLVRASALSDVPGTWWLPGGGVEFGESPHAAVVREVREETGFVARAVGAPIVVSDLMEVPGKGVVVHSVRVCYPLEIVGGEQRPEVDGSSDDVAWVPLDHVATLPTLPFVRRVLDLDDAAPDDEVVVVEGGRVRVEPRPQM